MSQPRLGDAITAARTLRVTDDFAVRHTTELLRLARVSERIPPRRRIWPLLAGGSLALAAAVAIWFGQARSSSAPATVVQIGDRISLAAQPGTRYAVRGVGERHTQIELLS